MDAVSAGFGRLVDYAGLYPPASLDLERVVVNYGRYRASDDAWLLNRLILPADRLDRAARLAAEQGASTEDAWPVSALVGGMEEAESHRQSVAAHGTGSCLRVQAIETAASSTDEIAAVAALWPDHFERYVEVPVEPEPRPLLEALAAAGCSAKVRTGGVTPDKIISPFDLARFLLRAHEAGVRLKATAGLHHAIRGERALTYEDDSPVAPLHGFVNLVFAAALVVSGKIDQTHTEALLDDDRADVFRFGGRAGSWLNAVVTYGEFAHGRQRLLASIGSCSFEEPVSELKAISG
jgi:hypothetical protein